MMPKVSVIIPALNEEKSIGKVISAIPRNKVYEIIVVDNGSSDKTSKKALAHKVKVMHEPIRGYGRACLTGIRALDPKSEIIVFLDADYSDYPQDLTYLIKAIEFNGYDLVVGSRLLLSANRKVISKINQIGNKLACLALKLFFNTHYTDLGPFRALRRRSLDSLKMKDRNFGWTIEMQIKAALCGLKVKEIPVRYRKRLGKSKVTGTFRGSVKAFTKITYLIFKYFIKNIYFIRRAK